MSERDRLVHALVVVSKADFHSRPQVLRNISQSCREECLTLYQHCLKDENPKVRIQAAKILVTLMDKAAIDCIRPLEDDSDWRVRRSIKKMLKALYSH